ncbi:cytochrome c oxidase assembly protein COX18, mitochondrial isoform X2 [Antennarius striatus]
MFGAGGPVRSGVLRLPVRQICPALLNRKSPASGHNCPALLSAGPPVLFCHTLSAQIPSGIGALSATRKPPGVRPVWSVRTTPGVRSFSGGDAGGADFYRDLSDSALVHQVEHFLVATQQVSGLPWWLNIAVSTLVARTFVTLPLAVYQMVILSRVEALQQEISEVAKRLRYEVSVRAKQINWTEKECRLQFKKNLRRIVSELYVRDNCHPFKASLLVWVQVPLWISLSLALRKLSLEHSALQSELAAGGALWFPDLTVPDSTWILPVCVALTNLLIIEMFSLKMANPSRFQRIMTNFFRVLAVLMIPIGARVPSAMVLYWFSSSLVGLGHNLLLLSPAVTRVLRLKTPRSDTPYRDLLSAFKSKYFK